VTDQSLPVEEIINASKSRGFLAKQLYVIFTTPAKELSALMEELDAHLDYQESLEAQGIMFAAGPHWTDDEKRWTGDGMIIVRAASMAEARQIAAKDPMHASGARTFNVRPWLLNEGTLDIKIGFATGKFELW
jgi:uncharacterized protein